MKTVLPLAFALALAPVQLVWSRPAAQPAAAVAAFDNGPIALVVGEALRVGTCLGERAALIAARLTASQM